MDSERESRLMERYFTKLGIFASLGRLPVGSQKACLAVFMARSYKDRQLQNHYNLPEWIYPLQTGAALADMDAEDNDTKGIIIDDKDVELHVPACRSGSKAGSKAPVHADNTGQHISGKNANYCELTALYWIWKNILPATAGTTYGDADYLVLFHYRRILDITQEDLYRLREEHVDAVLQFPTLHEPDIGEHHARYMKEADWEAMCTALWELRPEYARALPRVLAQPYFYNYNLIVARREVLRDYCDWLFPVLERTEELSRPRGSERADRYIGYLGENLMTLYFLYHKDDLTICHAGRRMLT